jgi:seryl-tRNA(Sec) selenium transferase
MLAEDVASLEARAREVVERAGPSAAARLSVVPSEATLGGGSAPVSAVPSAAVRVAHVRGARGRGSAEDLASALRRGVPSVFGRVREGAVLLDMRTVASGEIEALAAALKTALDALG